LLLHCLRRRFDPVDDRVSELLGQELDWPYLLRFAEGHGVLPLLAQGLLQGPDPERVPAAARQALSAALQENGVRNLFLAGELIRLLQVLEAQGIQAVPYKGPILAASLYGQLALRQIHDLDLLVRPADTRRAGEVLLSQGYQAEAGDTGHHDGFRSGDSRVRVELHWRITPRIFEIPLDLDGCWARLQPVWLAGTSVPSLAPEDLLLFLCAHGSKHGWERLLWIADIAELARAQPALDWQRVLDEARRPGCGRMLSLGLSLADSLLGAPLPAAVRARVRADPKLRVLTVRVSQRLFVASEAPVRVLEGFWLCWGALEGRPQKLRFAWHFLARRLTPNEADRALGLPSPFSPLYYLLRPLRLAGLYGWSRWRRFRAVVGRRVPASHSRSSGRP
jgi:hypothetical protein